MSHVPAPKRKPRALFVGYEQALSNELNDSASMNGFDPKAVRSLEEALAILRSAKAEGNPIDLLVFETQFPPTIAAAADSDLLFAEREKELVKWYNEGMPEIPEAFRSSERLDASLKLLSDMEAGVKLVETGKQEGLFDTVTHIHSLNSYSMGPMDPKEVRELYQNLNAAAQPLGKKWKGVTDMPFEASFVDHKVFQPALKAALQTQR